MVFCKSYDWKRKWLNVKFHFFDTEEELYEKKKEIKEKTEIDYSEYLDLYYLIQFFEWVKKQSSLF